jgi:hypothetical protein
MSGTGQEPLDAIRLFSDYLRLTGVAHTVPEAGGLDGLRGKRLGLLNGSSWITLWSTYFGRLYLPGVHLINVGNEAVQVNFMEAHERGQPVPPQANIDAFVRHAHDLVDLGHVDMVMITCSTMNRAYRQVEAALAPRGVPVLQIDRPLMERAVAYGGSILVVATHGPTVKSTQALLQETAAEMGRTVTFDGLTVEGAWHRLAVGDVEGHNQVLAEAIEAALAKRRSACVVLAQLSMAALLFSFPDPMAAFGVPVFTSPQCGFERAREQLLGFKR